MSTVVTQTLYRRTRAKGEVVLATEPPREPEWKPTEAELTVALAWHFLDLLDRGVVENQAELARRFGLSRARITQVLNALVARL